MTETPFLSVLQYYRTLQHCFAEHEGMDTTPNTQNEQEAKNSSIFPKNYLFLSSIGKTFQISHPSPAQV